MFFIFLNIQFNFLIIYFTTRLLLELLKILPEDQKAKCMLAENNNGDTPLDILIYHHTHESFKLFDMISEKNLEYLLLSTNNKGDRPLHTVAYDCADKLLPLLEIEKIRNNRSRYILAADIQGETLLHVLAANNPQILLELMKTLKNSQISECVSAQDTSDLTPLHLLGLKDPNILSEVVKMIPKGLGSGGEIIKGVLSIRDGDGFTAFGLLLMSNPDGFKQVYEQLTPDYQKYVRESVNVLGYINAISNKSMDLVQNLAEDLVKLLENNQLLKEILIEDICRELKVVGEKNIDEISNLVFTQDILLLFGAVRSNPKLKNTLISELQKGPNYSVVLEKIALDSKIRKMDYSQQYSSYKEVSPTSYLVQNQSQYK